MPVNQKEMEQGRKYNSAILESPRLSNWFKTHGGPIYIAVGSNEEMSNYFADETDQYSYTSSFVEYYYYKQPVIKDIYPSGGPIEGGTQIVVKGAWFKFIPEYGVMPYCKIGNSVTKGIFESTVRVICPSPRGTSLNTRLPVSVSLNGVDFIDTGRFFNYYKHSKLTGIHPDAGESTGGTPIQLKGEFSDLGSQEEFKCRFRANGKNVPPKYVPARYLDQTSVKCASPGSWGDVEEMVVDVTQNGVDYTPNA